MTAGAKNLGLVKAIHAGNAAPANTAMLWYSTIDFKHYYHNGTVWVPLSGSGGGSSGSPKLTFEYVAGSVINGKVNGVESIPQLKKSVVIPGGGTNLSKSSSAFIRVAVDRNGNDGEILLKFIDPDGGMDAMHNVLGVIGANESEASFNFIANYDNVGQFTIGVMATLGSYEMLNGMEIEII